MAISGIRIYWFEEGDGRRPEERIAAAAADLTGGPAAVSEWEIRREARGKPYLSLIHILHESASSSAVQSVFHD